MSDTKQQSAIIRAVQQGENVAIKARAGVGKSYTLGRVIESIPKTKKILYSCFNKHNIEAFKEKKYRNVICKTAHSLGFGLLQHALGNTSVRIRDDKSVGLLKEAGVKGGRRIDQQKAWDMFRLYGGYAEEDWEYIMDYIPQSLERAAGALMEPDMTDKLMTLNKQYFDDQGIIDYVDMLYLPVFLGLDSTLGVDVLMLDEAQDLPVATLKLLEHLSHQDMQVVVALDPMQNIYQSLGAGINNLEDLMGAYGLKVMPLTVCFRCKSEIITRAQRFVPDIHAYDGGGSVEFIQELPAQLEPNAMVIAPTNGLLIQEFIPRRLQGDNIQLRGHNFFEVVYKQVLKTHAKLVEQTGKVPEFVTVLHNCDTGWQDALDKLPHTKGNEERRRFLNNCLLVSEAAQAYFDSLTAMRSFLADMEKVEEPDNVFSTIHRSKGCEAETIYLVGATELEERLNKGGYDAQEAAMLYYVGITRAQEELFIIP